MVLGPFQVQEFKIAERGAFYPVSTYPGRPAENPAGRDPAQPAANGGLRSPQEWPRQLRAQHSARPVRGGQVQSEPGHDGVDRRQRRLSRAGIQHRAAVSQRPARPRGAARAVSRDDLLDVAEGGLATPQYSFIQPTNTKWSNPNVEKYDFNLDRAKQLLQDAGYQLQGGQLMGKDGQPVKLQVLYPTSSAPRAKIATYLQQQYKQLGIDVEVKGLDFNAFTDQVNKKKDFDISLATYGGGSLDPELGPRAQLITGGQQNVTGFSNPDVDELFKQGASELDDTKRKQIYDQFQQIVNADLPSHYLYALKAFSPVSKKVQGVVAQQGRPPGLQRRAARMVRRPVVDLKRQVAPCLLDSRAKLGDDR